jgi:hypothetical protein
MADGLHSTRVLSRQTGKGGAAKRLTLALVSQASPHRGRAKASFWQTGALEGFAHIP